MEFKDKWPGVIPEARAYRLHVEAQVSHRKRWQRLAAFDLQLAKLTSPRNYITYSNSPQDVTEQNRLASSEILEEIRKGWGLIEVSNEDAIEGG